MLPFTHCNSSKDISVHLLIFISEILIIFYISCSIYVRIRINFINQFIGDLEIALLKAYRLFIITLNYIVYKVSKYIPRLYKIEQLFHSDKNGGKSVV